MEHNYYRLLSYPLTVKTYGYGGKREFTINKDRSIFKGDSCNTYTLNLSNHAGTHMDCPNHFYDSGKKINRYKIQEFIFSNPAVIDCPKSDNMMILEEDVRKHYLRLKKTDLLLLRTGFNKYRGTDRYVTENPGIAPEAARFIRKRLGNIRCLGIDTISVSPYKNRELGRATHKILFKNNFKSEPLRLIEDMNLSGKLDNLKKVYAFPLLVKGIDSSPCTVVGFLQYRKA